VTIIGETPTNIPAKTGRAGTTWGTGYREVEYANAGQQALADIAGLSFTPTAYGEVRAFGSAIWRTTYGNWTYADMALRLSPADAFSGHSDYYARTTLHSVIGWQANRVFGVYAVKPNVTYTLNLMWMGGPGNTSQILYTGHPFLYLNYLLTDYRDAGVAGPV
jgi:hypothetical protein